MKRLGLSYNHSQAVARLRAMTRNHNQGVAKISQNHSETLVSPRPASDRVR
ncbi:hypothetical protein GCM10010191_94460 [Actinomadura vinacea]|uniref:Uncharacterized protein n=1 Tax=Actinomadura vinacea TaxID=115336 RepID=A0ABN3KGL3_9ACTN